MLIKFFARGQGSGSGPVEYCTRADIEGREHCPPVVLRGDAELTLSEHKKLAENFLNASKVEFDTIRNAIQEQSKTTAQTLGVMLRWPLWTAAGCIVIVLTALVTLWAGTTWARSELSEIRTATATERQTLSQLQNQTGQIRIINSEKGTFLMLPKGQRTDGSAARIARSAVFILLRTLRGSGSKLDNAISRIVICFSLLPFPRSVLSVP